MEREDFRNSIYMNFDCHCVDGNYARTACTSFFGIEEGTVKCMKNPEHVVVVMIEYVEVVWYVVNASGD